MPHRSDKCASTARLATAFVVVSIYFAGTYFRCFFLFVCLCLPLHFFFLELIIRFGLVLELALIVHLDQLEFP